MLISGGERVPFTRVLGFVMDKPTKPSYYYVKGKDRFDPALFKKTELVAQGSDPKLSMMEMMAALGYHRIFDCGTNRYVWHRPQ